ncbi:MAG: hypothetical protein HDQ88_01110 [Clostridia bacterium]|nr:hypothetical protein [Clostridia bacterium]
MREIAKNLSMQAFCSIHNVPYNAFEKYLKFRRHFPVVHHITVTDLPEESDTSFNKDQIRMAKPAANDAAPSAGSAPSGKVKVRIMLHIRMSNGMQLSSKNMDYRELLTIYATGGNQRDSLPHA